MNLYEMADIEFESKTPNSPVKGGNIFKALRDSTYTAIGTVIAGITPLVLQEIVDENKLREFDIPPLDNVFDHVGNVADGGLISYVSGIAGIGYMVSRLHKGKEVPKKTAVAVGVASAALAATVNYAYESGISIPFVYEYDGSATADLKDAAYGAFGGVVVAGMMTRAAIADRVVDQASLQEYKTQIM
jgi:hypothetical protein